MGRADLAVTLLCAVALADSLWAMLEHYVAVHTVLWFLLMCLVREATDPVGRMQYYVEIRTAGDAGKARAALRVIGMGLLAVTGLGAAVAPNLWLDVVLVELRMPGGLGNGDQAATTL